MSLLRFIEKFVDCISPRLGADLEVVQQGNQQQLHRLPHLGRCFFFDFRSDPKLDPDQIETDPQLFTQE